MDDPGFFPSKAWRELVFVPAGFLLLLLVGCGPPDLKFHRPNLIVASPDSSFMVLNDAHAKRLLVLDRNFRLVREIRHPNIDGIWGLDASGSEIVACNFRRVGVGRTKEEKEAFTIVEFLFFDLMGGLNRSFSWQGRSGPLKTAGAFLVEPDGSFLAADSRQNCLVRIGSAGQEIGFIASYGAEPGQLYYPNDVLKVADGNLLVVDAYNSRLQLFEPDGRFLKVIAERGEEPGKVMFPQFLASDPDGNSYCTELYAMRISVFDPQLNFLRTFQPPRKDDHELQQLYGLCVLASPTEIVAVDCLKDRLYRFDGLGNFLETIEKCRPP